MNAVTCSPRMFYGSDPSTQPPTLHVVLQTSCGSPDMHCTRRGLSSDAYECRSCGGRGIVDNGGGN